MRKVLHFVDTYCEEGVCAGLLVLLMSFLMIQVVMRYVFSMALAWNEELTRFFFVWFSYLGASLGVQRQGHIRVLSFILLFPNVTLRRVALLVSDGLWLAFMLIVVVYSFDFLEIVLRFPQGSAVLDIPLLYVYVIIPGGFLLMSLRLLQLYWRSWTLTGTLAPLESAAGEAPPFLAKERRS